MSEDPVPYGNPSRNKRPQNTGDNLIERLEIYRLENRLSQEKLADMLGVSFATVNRWLNNKTVPSKIQTYHIEKLLQQSSGRKSHGHA